MNHLTRKIALLLLATQNLSPAYAQADKEFTEKDIKNIVDTIFYGYENGYINNKSVAGAAIGISWKGKTYCYSYGLADRERNIRVTNSTSFEIGSNTKVFTGLMLASPITSADMAMR